MPRWMIFLDDDFVRDFVEARIENRMLFQSFRDRFKNKRREREFDAFCLVSRREFFAKLADAREINVVELRDARDGIPAFSHAPHDDLAQRRERFFHDRTPLRKINLFGGRFCRRSSARRLGLCRSPDQPLNVSAQIADDNSSAGFAATDFAKIDSKFARHFADGRRRGDIFVGNFFFDFGGFLNDFFLLGFRRSLCHDFFCSRFWRCDDWAAAAGRFQ